MHTNPCERTLHELNPIPFRRCSSFPLIGLRRQSPSPYIFLAFPFQNPRKLPVPSTYDLFQLLSRAPILGSLSVPSSTTPYSKNKERDTVCKRFWEKKRKKM